MEKSRDSSARLTNWGNSLLNKLPAVTRNRRKRDASKRRRDSARRELAQALQEKPAGD